jgi:RNA polymerase sigma-70 factor (ECF subfamily)
MPSRFPTTSWGLVLSADRPTAASRDALGALCRIYWHPVYSYIRSRGHAAFDAEDLTQEFFTRLLEKHYLRDVRRERGRFRVFLLASVKHFLANEWDRARAKKRGGGKAALPLDIEMAESVYRSEPVDRLTPEVIFERRWALTLLDRVVGLLENKSAAAGKAQQFNYLKPFLTGNMPDVSYQQVARELAMTEGAVKMAVHRMRKQFGELLRAELAEVVADPAEIDDEIRYLLNCVTS